MIFTPIRSDFLSRLCGGEHICIALDRPEGFLSRLCGGELS